MNLYLTLRLNSQQQFLLLKYAPDDIKNMIYIFFTVLDLVYFIFFTFVSVTYKFQEQRL